MIEQIHEYHKQGMSYGKIAKVMGLSKNKVLSMHRKFRFGVPNSTYYKMKEQEPQKLTNVITLPMVSGVTSPKYNYRRMSYVG